MRRERGEYIERGGAKPTNRNKTEITEIEITEITEITDTHAHTHARTRTH